MAALDCELVMEVLSKYPDAVGERKMLLAGLPHATADPPASRHAMQVEIIQMTSAALGFIKKETEDFKAMSIKARAGVQTDMEANNKSVQEAEAVKAQSATDQTAKEECLSAMKRKVSEIEPSFSEASGVEKKAAAEKAKKRKVLDDSAFVMDSSVTMLANGGWEDSEARDAAIEMVVGLLEEINAEKTLVAAVPGSYKPKPEQRGPFDKLCVDGVTNVVGKHRASLEADFATAEQQATEATAEALGLWALLDVEKQAKSDAQAGLEFAKDAVKKAAAALKQLQDKTRKGEKALSSVEESVEAAEVNVNEIDGALSAVQKLTSGESYAEEAPAKVEEEPAKDVVMQDAPVPAAAEAPAAVAVV